MKVTMHRKLQKLKHTFPHFKISTVKHIKYFPKITKFTQTYTQRIEVKCQCTAVCCLSVLDENCYFGVTV